MRHTLPSIPLEKFTEEVFVSILKIYGDVAEIRNPCETSIDPRESIESIWVDLSNHLYCEFHFGSSITMHSKLFLYPVMKKDCMHVGFDFDPNTADDSHPWPHAVTMRENFHREVQKYLDTLEITEGDSHA